MGLRRMFMFILLLALAFSVGTFLGSWRTMPTILTLPRDAVSAARPLDKTESHVDVPLDKPGSHVDVNNGANDELEGTKTLSINPTNTVKFSVSTEKSPARPIPFKDKQSDFTANNVKSKSNKSSDFTNQKEDNKKLVPDELRSSHLKQSVQDNPGVSHGKAASKPSSLDHQNGTSVISPNNKTDTHENVITAAEQNKPKGQKPIYLRESFALKELDRDEYVKTFSATVQCLVEGTNMTKTNLKSNKECACLPGWHGISCSVPEVVFKSNYPSEFGIMLRDNPRRIIYAMPFSHEFDLLEAKMSELYKVVDVFLILESNWTAAGKPKERFLLNKLAAGFLEDFHEKIVYISLDYFPKAGYMDGWVADALLRDHMGLIGVKKILKHVKDDDVIVINDADELPLHETLLFLKINSGYPQPVGFRLRHTVFGFFWEGAKDDETSEVYGAATISMLRALFGDSVYAVRASGKHIPGAEAQENMMRKYGVRTRPWSFGSRQNPAGWHCSWCFTPEGIQMKLHYAHVSDEPRYGQIEGKDSLIYIQRLIKTGTWFDNKAKFTQIRDTSSELFAPSFFMQNWKRFSHLLSVPT